jgi:hypothetical protein
MQQEYRRVRGRSGIDVEAEVEGKVEWNFAKGPCLMEYPALNGFHKALLCSIMRANDIVNDMFVSHQVVSPSSALVD